jgi:hypothetical protein
VIFHNDAFGGGRCIRHGALFLVFISPPIAASNALCCLPAFDRINACANFGRCRG